eukprot:TRINITY_DN1345_c0_g1_i2.p1 TRINITY_DN1345_c0_g1~~TRINITY_DN1345_c0_g1_i2.p1  ORF type:complete len:784 (+),score=242.09 TRINITY_DN1345_c0_g1_i2:136-2487(+)
MSGVTREEELQKRQEDLSLVVEPLVDSISELVLSSVTGAFENVQKHCMDIADRTNKLVLIAQQVATSSTDVDLQMEVANAINDVAASIEKLVISFTEILADSNPKTQEGFAAAAKEVGEAINKLCAATDETSQRKIIAAVRDAVASAKEVQESAFRGREALLAAAQLNVDKTVRLVKVATLAAGSTADDKKKKLLLDGAEKVRAGGPALIQAAKMVSERPADGSARDQLDARGAELTAAFTSLINAAKLSPMYFGKVAETYEYVKRLIEAAQDLEEAATNLYTITQNGTTAQFVESAKLAASKALQLVNQAEEAMKMEKDPVKKRLIKDAVAELRDASGAMIRAAKAYRENPNDPQAKADLDEAHLRLEAAIRRVVGLTGGEDQDQTPKGKLAMTANALESAARAVVESAKNNPKDLLEDAQSLAAIAMQLAKDIENVALDINDPVQKKRLLENAAEIKNAVQRLIAAAKRVAENPNDPQAQKELAEAHKYLLDKLNAVRRDAQIGGGGQAEEDASYATLGTEEMQLINAAREEASAALQLAAEAEKIAEKMTDPAKKALIKAAIKEVQLCSQRVIDMAEHVSKNPRDAAAQHALADAQHDLGNAIQRVVDLTSTKNDELADAMAAMKLETTAGSASEQNLLKSAQQVLDQIAATFGSDNNMSPEQVIANARELSTKAQELARQLREMAEKTTDPVYKEKLLQAAKIIRDGSIQVKILSAVKAAGGKNDKSNAVQMAAKGLQANITEVIKVVQAEGIRNRFRSTVKQTIAINKVVRLWRAGNK